MAENSTDPNLPSFDPPRPPPSRITNESLDLDQPSTLSRHALVSASVITITNSDQWPITVTSGFVPLTTQFTQPAECAVRWVRAEESDPVTLWSSAPSTQAFPWDTSYLNCQASSVEPSFRPGACYAGQTIAKVDVIIHGEEAARTTLWSGACCQSGMTLGEYGSGVYCGTTFSGTFKALSSVSIVDPGTTTLAYYDGSTSYTTAYTTGIALAEPVHVAWVLEDLNQFPSEYSLSVAQIMGIAASSAQPFRETATASGSNNPDNNHRLSTGAIAGIVVGAIIGGALMISLVVFSLMRRQRKKKTAAVVAAQVSQQRDVPGVAEMEDQEQRKGRWFLDGQWRSENAARPKTAELDSRREPVKLEAPISYSTGESLPHRAH
ncbi:hypothetical protein M011DRAFT_470420 [Sporormia fimetaria CBS 119925]|uniref:Uncharacterized protein n=1 Tax=Sporormia fimetaria CBS 119925 TaxID=1340428 RepID=A0A6A6V3H1_9PLEO|nr:hypothetical protein M011DRAFT_470420 [Sporormia fimetaria CBS 119925]